MTNFLFLDERHIVTGASNEHLAALFTDCDAQVSHVSLDEVFSGGGRVRCATMVHEREHEDL